VLIYVKFTTQNDCRQDEDGNLGDLKKIYGLAKICLRIRNPEQARNNFRFLGQS
jgi:hypothetical protein